MITLSNLEHEIEQLRIEVEHLDGRKTHHCPSNETIAEKLNEVIKEVNSIKKSLMSDMK